MRCDIDKERYEMMARYKATLDIEWKKRDPINIYGANYDNTISESKQAGFRVMRNPAGEHKLIDRY